jgi:uncharacterized protein YbjT (DUF2867 family)
MEVLITGASGMVGMGVLLECLEDERITKVVMANRSTVEMNHPKVSEVLVPDFKQPGDALSGLSPDACYFCAGVTSAGKSEEAYTELTYTVTVEFAKAVYAANSNCVFCYVSGAGTDSTEEGRVMWARVKGRTENALKAMGFDETYLFRPGYIQPMKGIKTKTRLYAALYAVSKPLYHLILKHIKGAATSSVNVGKAMMYALLEKPKEHIVDNHRINEWAKAYDQLTA